jgi:hypothetical protein
MPPFANTRRIKALGDDRRKSNRAPARPKSSGVLGNRTGAMRVSENTLLLGTSVIRGSDYRMNKGRAAQLKRVNHFHR